VICSALLSSCGIKNLSTKSREQIKTVSINLDHITTEQKDVAALNFWFGGKRYNDFIPLLESDKVLAKILKKALALQIDSNQLWEVTDDTHSDVDIFLNYAVMLSQTADNKAFQMVLFVDVRFEDVNGKTLYKKTFSSDYNPYSNEKVVYPLLTYYHEPLALKHAIGAASVQISQEVIEDLGGIFHLPQIAVWEDI
jgi:hypothetical protein